MIVASMPAGSLVGALLVSYLGDKIGRKKTVIISGMIWVVGSTLQCASIVGIFHGLRDALSHMQPFRIVTCLLLVVLYPVSP
jgi:MFS family permease